VLEFAEKIEPSDSEAFVHHAKENHRGSLCHSSLLDPIRPPIGLSSDPLNAISPRS